MAGNLIVDEEYIRTEASNIRNAMVKVDDAIVGYQAIIDIILRSGIKDGQTSEALKAFSLAVGRLKGDMRQAGNSVKQLMDNYLIAIDDADRYLF